MLQFYEKCIVTCLQSVSLFLDRVYVQYEEQTCTSLNRKLVVPLVLGRPDEI